MKGSINIVEGSALSLSSPGVLTIDVNDVTVSFTWSADEYSSASDLVDAVALQWNGIKHGVAKVGASVNGDNLVIVLASDTAIATTVTVTESGSPVTDVVYVYTIRMGGFITLDAISLYGSGTVGIKSPTASMSFSS